MRDPGPLHPQIQMIDPSCLFLIMWLKWVKMYITVTSIIHNTVPLDRSKSPDLNRTVERESNS
jgi:hypothetical protein